ncbi:DUF2157 domain-containing protein [Actinopolyspora mzabensis]|uniref:DUF2157 domain-containing protein n=1 Tax=Actinopolyspora mzabensis TaxID=995066 RepID=UPI0015A35E18|nr:DUF2157 domain-containing protein [Actinopolyspora mzabensis]
MTNRTRHAALYELVDDGVLSAEQAEAALEALRQSESRTGSRRILRETAGYLGGALVLAGGGLLAELTYDTLARPTRVAILLVVSLLFAATGLYLLGGRPGPRTRETVPGARRRLSSLLFALCALTGASAVSVAVPDFVLLPAMVTGLVLALLGWLAVPAPPGLPALAVAAVATVHSFAGFWFDHVLSERAPASEFGQSELTGLLLLLLGTLWCLWAARRVTVTPTFALALGVTIVLLGSFWVSSVGQSWWGHALALLVAALLLAGFVWRRDLVLLVGGLVALIAGVRDTVADLMGSVGLAVLVLVLGALTMSLGAFAMRRPDPAGSRSARGGAAGNASEPEE